MTRFLATRLDLTRLISKPPEVLRDIDFEDLLVEFLARLQEEAPSIDVLELETDPLVRLARVASYRDMLDRQYLNEALRQLLPSYATGANLEQIAARSAILRLTGETDDTLRMRYFASFGAPAAGSEDAYVFAALTAAPTLWDVRCVGPAEHGEPGKVDVVLTAAGGVATASSVVLAVGRAINGKSVRPLTDEASAMAATIVPYAVSVQAQILPGPDPAAVRADIRSRLEAIVAERYRGGGEVPLAALTAAAFAAGAVSATVTSPSASIARNPYAAPWCTSIAVSVTERLVD